MDKHQKEIIQEMQTIQNFARNGALAFRDQPVEQISDDTLKLLAELYGELEVRCVDVQRELVAIIADRRSLYKPPITERLAQLADELETAIDALEAGGYIWCGDPRCEWCDERGVIPEEEKGGP